MGWPWRASVGSLTPFPWTGRIGQGSCPLPGNLRNGRPCLITDLCPRPLLLVVSVLDRGYRKAHIWVNLHFELSWWAGRKQNPLCPKVGFVPGLTAGSPRAEWALYLFPNPFFRVSLTSAQPERLGSGCWWRDTVGWEQPQGKGEEEGALSQAEGDLQSRTAVCALLVLESIALAIGY